MFTLRKSQKGEEDFLVAIWNDSVLATHHFLKKEDFDHIKKEVEFYVSSWIFDIAVDTDDIPIAFMGMRGDKIDSLFISPEFRGKGIGRKLIEKAISNSSNLFVDVNEQNEQGLGFYLKLGFEIMGRSDTDDAGRAYPILHLKLKTL